MTHCFNCNFTASNNHFENPIQDYAIKQESFIKKFLNDQKKKKVKIVTKILTKNFQTWEDFIKDGFVSGNHYLNLYLSIKINLLAIFQLLQYKKTIVDKDSTELGTYHLRLAWLYRDLKKDEKTKVKVSSLFKKLEPYWEDVPTTEKRALNLAMQFYNQAIDKSRTVSSITKEITMLIQIVKIRLKYNNIMDAYGILMSCIAKTKQFKIKKDKYIATLNRKISNRANKNVADMTDIEKKSYFDQPQRDEEAKKIGAKMTEESNIINIMVNETKEIFDDLKGDLEKDQRKKATEILEKIPTKASSELKRKALKKANIIETVIDKMVPLRKPKKKFLGIF